MSNITLSNVISNRVLDNNTWRDMTKQERITALEGIKKFLLSTCRGTTSEIIKAINCMSINNLPTNKGIYNRLTEKEYTAGQDYPSELNFIKAQIKREC